MFAPVAVSQSSKHVRVADQAALQPHASANPRSAKAARRAKSEARRDNDLPLEPVVFGLSPYSAWFPPGREAIARRAGVRQQQLNDGCSGKSLIKSGG